VIIVAHRSELNKSTGTARLVARMLDQATLLSRSDSEPREPLASEGAVLLFPSEQSVPLSSLPFRPTTLVVPDGTWAQARRIVRRDPYCQGLAHVRLDVQRESAYQLRRNPRPGGLCTLEAVAEALRVLDGDVLAGTLLSVFADWVMRSQRVRAGDHERSLV
jgi:DTW domain-containing protein YfiP